MACLEQDAYPASAARDHGPGVDLAALAHSHGSFWVEVDEWGSNPKCFSKESSQRIGSSRCQAMSTWAMRMIRCPEIQ